MFNEGLQDRIEDYIYKNLERIVFEYEDEIREILSEKDAEIKNKIKLDSLE